MRYQVVILGAGNVGHHLAQAYARAGCSVSVWSRTDEHARETASLCGGKLLVELAEIPENTQLCIASVSETAMDIVCSQLPDFEGILVHTAGSVPMSVLKPYKQQYGVIYPLQTFSRTRKPDYGEIPLFIEASDDSVLQFIREISSGVFRNIYELDSIRRGYLHLSAVFACNFANAALMGAQEIAEQHEMNFEFLLPLIRETFEKAMADKPDKSQTGPAVRNNRLITRKHAEMLQEKPVLQNMYNAITNYILERFKHE